MNEAKAKPTTCNSKRVLIDVKCVIEPRDHYSRYMDLERQANCLEDWAKEMMEFFRDHRSQDVNGITVERVYEEQCDACKREWEECEYEADGDQPAYIGCSYCGLPMEIVR